MPAYLGFIRSAECSKRSLDCFILDFLLGALFPWDPAWEEPFGYVPEFLFPLTPHNHYFSFEVEMGEHSGDVAPGGPAKPARLGSGLVFELAGQEGAFLFEFCQNVVSKVRILAKPLLDSRAPNWPKGPQDNVGVSSHHVIVEGIVLHQNNRRLMCPVLE